MAWNGLMEKFVGLCGGGSERDSEIYEAVVVWCGGI